VSAKKVRDRVTASEDPYASGSTIGNRERSWVGIVDDDASLRLALARALRGSGIRVETFGSAEEFLHRAVLGEPECIVLDIHLGASSGFDLEQQLAEDGIETPIIYITAHDDLLPRRARQECDCRILRKPFDISTLIALVRPHLSSSSSLE